MLYGSIDDWRTYAEARGETAPTAAEDSVATQSLQRASDYIRTRYAIRLGLSETDERVIEATYIAATYDLAKPGFWQTTFKPSQAKRLTKVDGIQWTPTGQSYKGADADYQVPVSPAIEGLFGEGRTNDTFMQAIG